MLNKNISVAISRFNCCTIVPEDGAILLYFSCHKSSTAMITLSFDATFKETLNLFIVIN